MMDWYEGKSLAFPFPPKYAAQIAMMRARREISKETSGKLVDYYQALFIARRVSRSLPFNEKALEASLRKLQVAATNAGIT